MLSNLTDIAVNFDPSLILICWKFLVKFIFRIKVHLNDVIQVLRPITEQLCATMKSKTVECVKSDGSTLFGKLLKLCRFLSTLLVKMSSVSGVCVCVCTSWCIPPPAGIR